MSLFGAGRLYELLQVERGVTALIGGGGKTGLMYHLAGELSKKGKVLLCTTTHIRRPEHLPFAATAAEAAALLAQGNIVCVGTEGEDGKLTAPSFVGWESMADYVIVEADGSRQLPLKAHADHEPMIPAGCGNVICVVGAGGFDKPAAQVVHRPEIFMALAGISGMHTLVSPQMVAEVIRKEALCTRIFINQTDALPRFFGAGKLKDFAKEVEVPVVAGSLRQGVWQKLK